MGEVFGFVSDIGSCTVIWKRAPLVRRTDIGSRCKAGA
jgi:UDP-3-O-[3-hydroxymyristoyl] glucosamine N-acyltransferase